ncbi:MAG TPA: hypothetical protein VJH88_01830 [Candidatus Nanoarchaeia archaeon]|nr:hypothetical protein [Candidatus Nanoarchaeia archaeon]
MITDADPSNWSKYPSVVVMPDCPARASVVEALESDPRYNPPLVTDSIPSEVIDGLEIAVIDIDHLDGITAITSIVARNERARIIGLSAKSFDGTLFSARVVYSADQNLEPALKSYLSEHR